MKKESRMYPKISKLFEKDYYIFYNYIIPDDSRREIDLVCLEKCKCSEVVAVEVKVKDWKRALRQSFKRLFYVDRCYIALSASYVERIDLDMIGKYGIGLISVDGKAEIIMKARKSDKVISWRREMLLNDLTARINRGRDIL